MADLPTIEPALRRAFAQGDEKATEALLPKLTALITRKLRALKVPGQDEEDLTSDVLSCVLLGREAYVPEERIEPWVMTITRNRVLAHRREAASAQRAVSVVADRSRSERDVDPGSEEGRMDEAARTLWLLPRNLAGNVKSAVPAGDEVRDWSELRAGRGRLEDALSFGRVVLGPYWDPQEQRDLAGDRRGVRIVGPLAELLRAGRIVLALVPGPRFRSEGVSDVDHRSHWRSHARGCTEALLRDLGLLLATTPRSLREPCIPTAEWSVLAGWASRHCRVSLPDCLVSWDWPGVEPLLILKESRGAAGLALQVDGSRIAILPFDAPGLVPEDIEDSRQVLDALQTAPRLVPIVVDFGAGDRYESCLISVPRARPPRARRLTARLAAFLDAVLDVAVEHGSLTVPIGEVEQRWKERFKGRADPKLWCLLNQTIAGFIEVAGFPRYDVLSRHEDQLTIRYSGQFLLRQPRVASPGPAPQ